MCLSHFTFKHCDMLVFTLKLIRNNEENEMEKMMKKYRVKKELSPSTERVVSRIRDGLTEKIFWHGNVYVEWEEKKMNGNVISHQMLCCSALMLLLFSLSTAVQNTKKKQWFCQYFALWFSPFPLWYAFTATPIWCCYVLEKW